MTLILQINPHNQFFKEEKVSWKTFKVFVKSMGETFGATISTITSSSSGCFSSTTRLKQR